MTGGPPVPTSVSAGSSGLLEALCAISSSSGDVGGLRRVAERLGEELKNYGLIPEIHLEPGVNGAQQPLLVARGAGVEKKHLLLLGHLDTVLRAVPPKRKNGRLEGTGALDMKGGFAALVGALMLLRERGQKPPDDIVLVAVPDEEIGGPISAQAVRSWGARARAVLVLEPGGICGDGETLVTGRRGLSVWRLDCRGTPSHSGVAYWDGRSALAAAAAWTCAVQRMSEPNDGPVVNVGRMIGGDSDFVSDFGEEHRFIGTTERLNVVADRCLVEGEIRFLDPADRERTLARMRELAHHLGQEWEVEFEMAEVERIPPLKPSSTAGALADHLVGAANYSGWKLELESNRGGVSFPNLLPDPSAIPVIDGLGPVGDGMHTRGEYVDLTSLDRRIHLIAEALLYLRDKRETFER
jgi:glutamate carboxypeptidase